MFSSQVMYGFGERTTDNPEADLMETLSAFSDGRQTVWASSNRIE
jgi:hypothetical protein